MQDPDVAPVEAILSRAAARSPAPELPTDGHRLPVEHALWICACVTTDDAPTWLVYVTADGGLGWSRVPDGDEPLDLVEARWETGGHCAPAQVLDWLRTGVPDGLLQGHGTAERVVVDAIAAHVRA
ncbi:hypothetical protein ABFU82_06740 [Nocardioides sp. WV_118_6]